MSNATKRRARGALSQLDRYLPLVGVIGCAAAPPKPPNPVHPIEEARAVQVIAGTIRQIQATPAIGRSLRIPSGHTLTLDVAIAGRRYGIAYLTEKEDQELGSGIPRTEGDDALVVVQGTGEESETRILLLFGAHYVTDDSAGDQHERSTIVAERKLSRDVRDFIARARSQRWP